MEREPILRLVWRGDETVRLVPSLLQHAEEIEITLPASYNHALFRALRPDAPDGALEELDADGGPEVLAAFAKVKGLEAVARLGHALRDAQASVQVVSPPTLLITLPSAARQAE